MLSNERMRELILHGIEEANRTHIAWTRNCWVSDYGAEGLIQVRIAEAIFKADPSLSVWLEANVSELAEGEIAATLKDKGISGQCRPDVCTYLPDGSVPHIVEVKRKWDTGPLMDDIVRCARLTHHLGGAEVGLQGVFMAVFLHSTMNDEKKVFFPSDAKRKAEAVLEDKAAAAFQSHDDPSLASSVQVQAEVGPQELFNEVPGWPLEGNRRYDSWRWRAAVLQFTPSRTAN